jgi:hypothetical protein
MKLDLLTDATVVNDGVRFVSNYKNGNKNKNGNSDRILMTKALTHVI